ncbi:NAD(P)-dependent oxidoreductase [uncultured Brachyspira sp.]|uniref:NAD(P)-dependent oxidoreductase n=1 Tax=uncultured Brachyspira sp. TaxID=221953 RepID=UPI002605A23D|nr:NAD(P)-dependent oxidoreductase [uncultured Brachyspira sp.]
MKIAIIAANGKAGKLIINEALERGLNVTAIVRDKTKINNSKIKVIEKDLFDLTKDDLKEFDTVVSAFGVWEEKELDKHSSAMEHLCNILANTNIRLMVVGGAGSLYIDRDKKLMDSKTFPDIFKPLAKSMSKSFDILKNKKDVLWTYVSPSADFQSDGVKTGEYNIGNNELLFNSKGESSISYADYAIAFADEIQNKKYLNQQITFCSK